MNYRIQKRNFYDHDELIQQIRQKLNGIYLPHNWEMHIPPGKVKGSAVLFLLTLCSSINGGPIEPCLLLNKRSKKVLQPGDLCCPGGSVERVDKLLSWLIWPLSALYKWSAWGAGSALSREKARQVSLLFATALRESWEEMRLNPLKVAFIGPLPVQKLVMFNRKIFPLVGWVPPQTKLSPNWEVDKIVYIPLRRLLDARHYARYRLIYQAMDDRHYHKENFPCFVHQDQMSIEILWGATFRITMDFLNLVFGFEIPDLKNSQVINKRLGDTYFNGV